MARITKEDKQGAVNYLLTIVKPGDTIFTSMKHVSRSGMSRVIDLFIIKDNEPLRLSYSASILLEGYDRRHEGAKAGGCGMDMGFHLVYSLSRILWPRGYMCVGENCPSNDHSNGDRDYTPHLHKDGGYALIQRWL